MTVNRTPKQALLAHIMSHHPRLAQSPSARHATYKVLQQVHATEHHRYSPNHRHAGVNRGVSVRPPGWYTGLDVVEKR